MAVSQGVASVDGQSFLHIELEGEPEQGPRLPGLRARQAEQDAIERRLPHLAFLLKTQIFPKGKKIREVHRKQQAVVLFKHY